MKTSSLNTRSLKEDPFHAVVYGGQVATIKALCFYYGYLIVLTPFIQNISSAWIILNISEKFTWKKPPTLQYYIVIVLYIHKRCRSGAVTFQSCFICSSCFGFSTQPQLRQVTPSFCFSLLECNGCSFCSLLCVCLFVLSTGDFFL